MDEHLAAATGSSARSMSLADICLFAYTHVAGERTSIFSAIRASVAWIERVKGQPRLYPDDA